MDFGTILNNIKQLINPSVENGAIKSPIPTMQFNDNNNPAFQQYRSREAMGEQNTTPANFAPKTVQYPNWMANAPTQGVQGVQAPIPAASPLEETIKRGLTAYGSPLATVSADLATAGAGLPDPLLPTIKAILETSGGKAVTRGDNNIYNMLPTRAGVNYPDYKTAILGGGDQKGFKGIVESLYQNYLKSGKLEDFINKFSPPSDGNGTAQQQINKYNDIKGQYFTQ